MTEEDKSDLQHLQAALHCARGAFDKYFEDEGLEGAYYGFEFHGWVYGSDFSSKMAHAVIDDNGCHAPEKEGEP